MFLLAETHLIKSREELSHLPKGKLLINTINAHSYNQAQQDEIFAEALKRGDFLLPDGASIVMACRWLKGKSMPQERIAGWDFFVFEMHWLEKKAEQEKNKLRVMFMGSSEKTLTLIRERAAKDYPNLEILTYSPPYKNDFSEEENQNIINSINQAKPDLLWIGMTAPKQEKWTWQHWNELDICCHTGTIGAVFDFYAGTMKRAPLWMQRHSLEWLYRLIKEPKRMWHRYLIGNPLFLYIILKEYTDKYIFLKT